MPRTGTSPRPRGSRRWQLTGLACVLLLIGIWLLHGAVHDNRLSDMVAPEAEQASEVSTSSTSSVAITSAAPGFEKSQGRAVPYAWRGVVVDGVVGKQIAATIRIDERRYRASALFGFTIECPLRCEAVIEAPGYVSTRHVVELGSAPSVIRMASASASTIRVLTTNDQPSPGAIVFAIVSGVARETGVTGADGVLSLRHASEVPIFATAEDRVSSRVAWLIPNATMILHLAPYPDLFVRTQSGVAIPDVKLSLHYRGLVADSILTWRASSDNSGYVRLSGIPLGPYDCIASSVGFPLQPMDCAAGKLNHSLALELDGSLSKSVDLVFEPLASRSLRVLDAWTGKPLVGARVDTMRLLAGRWSSFGAIKYADEDGCVLWSVGPPQAPDVQGVTRLKVSSPGYVSQVLELWGSTTEKECQLVPLAELSSRIRVLMHERGRVDLRVVSPAGDTLYHGMAASGQEIALSKSCEQVDVFVDNILLGSFAIEGSVVDLRRRLCVIVMREPRADLELLDEAFRARMGCMLDSGAVEWSNLPPGRYYLSAVGIPKSQTELHKEVLVRPGETAVLDAPSWAVETEYSGKVLIRGAAASILVAPGWNLERGVKAVHYTWGVPLGPDGAYRLRVGRSCDFLACGIVQDVGDCATICTFDPSVLVQTVNIDDVEVAFDGLGDREPWSCVAVSDPTLVATGRFESRWTGPGPHLMKSVPNFISELTAFIAGTEYRAKLLNRRATEWTKVRAH